MSTAPQSRLEQFLLDLIYGETSTITPQSRVEALIVELGDDFNNRYDEIKDNLSVEIDARKADDIEIWDEIKKIWEWLELNV